MTRDHAARSKRIVSRTHTPSADHDRVRLPETRETLDSMLRGAGLKLDAGQIDRLWRFHTLIRNHDEPLDLTRLRTFRDFVVKHYMDCLLVPTLTRLPSPLLDIGTGAGFPGIPLKIAVPGCEIILAESRTKRVEFLRMAVETLGLEGISIFGKGILPGRLGMTVGGVITRALESASQTLARVADILDQGGLVILMKGPRGGEEIPEALERYGGDFRLKSDIPYLIPGTRNHRRLIVFEKVSPRKVQPDSPHADAIAITSQSNPAFREWKSLLGGRGIRKAGLALVSGRKIIEEVIQLRPEMIRAWIRSPRQEEPPASFPEGIPTHVLSAELFRELDVHGTGYPLLLVGIEDFTPLSEGAPEEDVVLLIPFQDPANVGAAIRSAAAFGIRSVVLLREAAHPFHPKSIRAGGTAVFLTRYFEGPSIESVGVEMSLPVVALSPDGADIRSFRFPRRFALLPGREGPGLPEGMTPYAAVRIPMEPDIESLNAAASVAVALFAWRGTTPEG
jgi:16S rRNA (guanine(527)-N(7))-methyltransferase RsmG